MNQISTPKQFELKDDDLAELKTKTHKIKQCHKILSDIIVNFMFIWILFVVCYGDKRQALFAYQNQIILSINSYQKVN